MKLHFLFALLLVSGSLLASAPALAKADFEKLLQHYTQLGGKDFNAERGKAFWIKDQISESGDKMNCATCHGNDLKQAGKHNKSGKLIEPMAPSVNPERFTDLEKVEKWFTRNCKQVLRRECSAQEKGDVLRYLAQF
jgi:Domain of unknown function (DUF1924)